MTYAKYVHVWLSNQSPLKQLPCNMNDKIFSETVEKQGASSKCTEVNLVFFNSITK